MFQLMTSSVCGSVVVGSIFGSAGGCINGINSASVFTSDSHHTLTTGSFHLTNALSGCTASGMCGSSNNYVMEIRPPTKYERRRNEREGKHYRAADNKAKKLLMALIGQTRYQLYKKLGYLEVFGQKYRYRLTAGQRVKVMAGPEGEIVDMELCVHPTEYVPMTDTMIAQLLLIRFNEDHLLEKANKIEIGQRIMPLAA